MPRRAILFDIDGTLVDSNPAHVEAWLEAFAAHGHHFDPSAIHSQIGKGGDNLVPSLLPDATEAERQRIADAHGEIYRRDHLQRLRPFPGARELLLKVRDAGMKVILASSASGHEVDHHLDLLDAREIVDASTSKDDVEHSKPCPDIFKQALAEAGVAPSEALVIGDTPYDIIAARPSGIDTIAVRSGGFADEDLAAEKPVAIYDDVAALLADFDRSPLGG